MPEPRCYLLHTQTNEILFSEESKGGIVKTLTRRPRIVSVIYYDGHHQTESDVIFRIVWEVSPRLYGTILSGRERWRGSSVWCLLLFFLC